MVARSRSVELRRAGSPVVIRAGVALASLCCVAALLGSLWIAEPSGLIVAALLTGFIAGAVMVVLGWFGWLRQATALGVVDQSVVKRDSGVGQWALIGDPRDLVGAERALFGVVIACMIAVSVGLLLHAT